jgi:uncharacterized protein (PEP-CTERM system associated)
MPRAEGARRALVARWFAAGVGAFACSVTIAQTLRLTPTLDGQVLYTNNVGLQPGPSAESDFVTTITPGLNIDYSGPRGFLRGSIATPITIYARDEDRSQITPVASLAGRGDIVKDRFFVEGLASVSQTYFSPFGARPIGIENQTENRYTAQTYQLSPVLQGNPTSLISYSIRDDNTWTVLSSTPVATDDVYTNRLFATINRQPTPLGWGADFQRTQYWFSGESAQRLMLTRARGVWQPDPQLRLFVTGGYEDNQFQLTESRGPTYGGGFSYRPTERTSLDVSYEHRFFGPSYNATFTHRTPMTYWSAQASRNISSYPEQLGQLPAGAFLPGILNALLVNRIPGEAERIAFIRQFLIDRGLPIFLSEPLSLYNQQIFLLEYAYASVGLIGVRNSVFASVYRSRTEPISGQGEALPPILSAQNNNTQTGVGISWAYQMSSATSLNASANYGHSEANPPFTQETDTTSVQLNLTRTLSPRTNVHAGARWQKSKSNENFNDFREAAVFAGFHYSFR